MVLPLLLSEIRKGVSRIVFLFLTEVQTAAEWRVA